ncbi:hypothetical protein [Thermovibrio sp.]
MSKPTFEEFSRAYRRAEGELLDVLLSQVQACEPCKVIDYLYCIKRCRVLRENIAKAKRYSDFFWIAKKTVYEMLQFVKAETYCKANGLEVDYASEFLVPPLKELPPEDEPVINALHELFNTECKACTLPVGKSCFECPKILELQKKLKTHLGQRIFTFFLTLNASVKRGQEERYKEIRFFYERIYEPPVKVNWFPKDPWGCFFWKVLEKRNGERPA